MRIQGPAYIERTSFAGIPSETEIKNEAERLADNFMARIGGTPDFEFRWNVERVDGYSQKHVEKWVEKVGLHFRLYATTRRSPAHIIPSALPRVTTTLRGRMPLLRLKYKVFSGDVSGSIGEALLAGLLRVRYRLLDSEITHLRATKTTGRAPDFYISRIPDTLANDLDPANPAGVNPPLVVEAKGATSFSAQIMKSKLARALTQIEMLRRYYGLVCIFVRDAPGHQYRILMVVVQP